MTLDCGFLAARQTHLILALILKRVFKWGARLKLLASPFSSTQASTMGLLASAWLSIQHEHLGLATPRDARGEVHVAVEASSFLDCPSTRHEILRWATPGDAKGKVDLVAEAA